jgi:peptide-methionine (S)-S-oxide reductase
MDGVVRTRVGYAGGTTDSPTYQNIGDHSETIQIEYDPDKITYEELLKVFWESHSSTVQPWSKQYRSIIFYHDDEQHRLAMETRRHKEAETGRKVFTEINPFSRFYLAEDYHQKYYLQQVRELMSGLHTIYPDFGDFVDSTVVARINGFLGGHGSLESLEERLFSFGLSPATSSRLVEITRKRLPAAGCSNK